jgi:hypothetical protein
VIKNICATIAVIVMFDALFVFCLTAGIATGDQNVTHIPFWDSQIKVVVEVLTLKK